MSKREYLLETLGRSIGVVLTGALSTLWKQSALTVDERARVIAACCALTRRLHLA